MIRKVVIRVWKWLLSAFCPVCCGCPLPPFEFRTEVADAVRQKLRGNMVWRPLILLNLSFFFTTVSRTLKP
jgi:hypothetical protein